MHHGVIANDPEPEHLLLGGKETTYMYQEPEEMPRLFLFTLPLLHLLLPIEFIKIQSNHSIQSSNAVSSLSPTYISRYLSIYPLEKMEMTFLLILIYHLRHPSSRENK